MSSDTTRYWEEPKGKNNLILVINSYLQAVPQFHETMTRAQNPIGAVADTIVSAADEVVEGLGDLITPSTQGNDYAETAWQRKLRNQANRKKKRRRGL